MGRHRQQNQTQKKTSAGSVRIISGLWRGRKLAVHHAEGLRPTSDRVKETLFNWLAQDIAQAKCLDVFAGSGGLGFEAASRQADMVTMLEYNPEAYRQLQSNINSLNATNLTAVSCDALQHLAKPGTPYDVVFLDPPFHKGLLAQVITLLESNHWLAENAFIYIETEKALQLEGIPEHWSLHREKTTSQVSYRLFIRENTE